MDIDINEIFIVTSIGILYPILATNIVKNIKKGDNVKDVRKKTFLYLLGMSILGLIASQFVNKITGCGLIVGASTTLLWGIYNYWKYMDQRTRLFTIGLVFASIIIFSMNMAGDIDIVGRIKKVFSRDSDDDDDLDDDRHKLFHQLFLEKLLEKREREPMRQTLTIPSVDVVPSAPAVPTRPSFSDIINMMRR